MKNTLLILLTCMLYLIAEPSSNRCLAVPPIEEIEQKAITYRLAHVKQGYVRLHVIFYEPAQRRSEHLFEVIFDKDRTQQSRRSRQLGEAEWGKPAKIIVTPKTYIDDMEFIDTPVAVMPAKLYTDPKQHARALNVQAVGMDTGGADLLHIAHVESLLNRSDRINPMLHAEKHKGLDTWRIEFKLKSPEQHPGRSISLWVAPSKGYGIIGIEATDIRNGMLIKTMIDTMFKQYPDGDIWYPSKVIKFIKQDDRVISHQEIHVEEARFVTQIVDADFSLSALDLRPGRQIVDSSSGRPVAKIWNGKEMVNPASVSTAPANSHTRRWILWFNAGALALLAVFYLRRFIKQRKASHSPGS